LIVSPVMLNRESTAAAMIESIAALWVAASQARDGHFPQQGHVRGRGKPNGDRYMHMAVIWHMHMPHADFCETARRQTRQRNANSVHQMHMVHVNMMYDKMP
jgi:hypothetical protein